jgi:hypothetical protein
MEAYGLNDSHWAQKNISRWADASTTCPVGGCGIGMKGTDPSGSLAGSPGGLFADWSWPSLVAPAAAQDILARNETAQTSKRRIALTGSEWERFGRTDGIIQFRTWGVADTSVYRTPRFRFIEPLGGAIQLYPMDAVKQHESIGTTFAVTNPDDYARTVFADIAVSLPPGAEGAPVTVEFRGGRMRPGQTRQTEASVGRSGGGVHLPGCSSTGRTGAAALGLFLVGFLLVRVRGREEP